MLLFEPGASWSTADVWAGLHYGLQQQGIEIIRYRLAERINFNGKMLYRAWKSAKFKNPDISKPTDADVFYAAAKDALFMALLHDVDCVLVVSAMYVLPLVMRKMRQAGIRVFVLLTESPYQPEELAIAEIVEGVWTNERSMLRTLRAHNPLSGYMPHGWHPERHKPGPQPGDEKWPAHDVVFVGSGFEERIEWLEAIDWRGIDLGLYGQWNSLPARHILRQYVRGQITRNEDTAALYRRAKLGLNLYRTSQGWGKNQPQIRHAESLNPRAYELAACGAFHLSTYRAEIVDVFGDLVPTFDTPDEASALIRTWLANPTGRADIAARLPACVRGMSWAERGTTIVNDLRGVLHSKPSAAFQRPQPQAVGVEDLAAVGGVGSR